VRRIPSAELREFIADCDRRIDAGGLPKIVEADLREKATIARYELTRRHEADECEVCGYGPGECFCRDNESPVLINEFEPEEVGLA
jgi:hypothetical protein